GGVVDAVIINGMHGDLVGVVAVGVGRRLVVRRYLERHLAGGGVDVEQVIVAAARQRIGDGVVGRGAVGVARIGVVHHVADGGVLGLAAGGAGREDRGVFIVSLHGALPILGGVVDAVIINGMHGDLVGVVAVGVGRRL